MILVEVPRIDADLVNIGSHGNRGSRREVYVGNYWGKDAFGSEIRPDLAYARNVLQARNCQTYHLGSAGGKAQALAGAGLYVASVGIAHSLDDDGGVSPYYQTRITYRYWYCFQSFHCYRQILWLLS